MKIRLRIISISFVLLSSCTSENSSSNYRNPATGDLNSSFANPKESQSDRSPEKEYQLEKEKLVAEGWEQKDMENGLMPSCYNFLPAYDKSVDNYLQVNVGGGTDVVIKLMDVQTDKCVRYVFINNRSSYKLSNIPQRRFYLKIAYGKEWLSRINNEQCVGKFLRNPLYEKGEEVMDFKIRNTLDGYSVPSYQLSLDVVSSNLMNSFSSHNISEGEFNE